MVQADATRARGIRNKHRLSLGNNYTLHLMLLPSVILLFIFSYLPMFGIVMAFQNYKPGPNFGFFGSKFAGLDNFRYIFRMPDAMLVIRNTVSIAVMKIICHMVIPVIVSLLLNEIRRTGFKRGVQLIMYLPHFLSWVILAGIFRDILSPSEGIINHMLKSVGFEPIFFLGDLKWFQPTMVITDVWKEFGYNLILYMAALTAIDPSLYEAATVDGANRFQQTIHITLPGIISVVVLLLTLSMGNVLNAGFDQIFNLYSPQVYSVGDIIDTLVYRLGIEDMQFSVSAAVGLFKSVVSFVLISTSYYLAYRFADYRIF